MKLKASDEVQFFKGVQAKMYDGHSLFDLENLEKLKANRYTTHATAEIKIFCTFELCP